MVYMQALGINPSLSRLRKLQEKPEGEGETNTILNTSLGSNSAENTQIT